MTTFQNTVYYGALQIPNDRFDAEVGRVGFNGCLRFSDAPGTTFPEKMGDINALAGACIRSGINLSSGTWNCFRNGNDFFDGGSLASTASFVYAAYNNVTRKTVALYRGTGSTGFTPVATPAPGGVNSHVLIKAIGGTLYMAFATGMRISLMKFDEAGNLWTTLEVASDFNRRFAPLKDGRVIRLRGFEIGLLHKAGGADVAVFWQRQVGSTNFTTLRGAICNSSLVCNFSTSLQPPNSSNNFMPSIASAIVNKPGAPTTYRHVISYWSDQSQTNTIAMRFAVFDGVTFNAQWAGGENVSPCLIKPDYFGDYDASMVRGNQLSAPRVSRLLTDSSGGACDSRDYRAFPHHVSELPLVTF